MAEPGTPPVIGIIGGSGIYEIEGLGNAEWRSIESPFGAPSDALLCGELDGQRLVFLPRHGRGRSEEHTSELQSLMRISYAVFCLKKKNKKKECIDQRDNQNI